MLRAEGLGYTYPNGTRSLRGVDLKIAESSFNWLCGASGGGKSTLIRALTGLIPHLSEGSMGGDVFLDGDNTREMTVKEISRKAGFVLQDPSTQLFGLDVRECVSFALQNSGLDDEDVRRQTDNSMNALGVSHLSGRPVMELSGGEQQLIAMASALALEPRYLLLDEPFSELDPDSARRLHDALRNLHAGGRTVLVAEHRLEMLDAGDFLAILGRGRITADGPAGGVLESSLEEMKRAGLRLPQTVEVSARLHVPLKLSTADFLKSWDGRIKVRPRSQNPGGEVLMKLSDIHYSYPKNDVLRGVDLEIRGGELLFVVGRNGSGKTTLARIAAGLVRPRSGEVELKWAHRRRRRGPYPDVGLVFQHPERQLLGVTVGEEAPAAVLSRMGLSGHSGTSPHLLSRGQKMRLALAGVLARKPRVVIVDEPTLGQDGRGIKAIFSHLRRLYKDGAAVIVITHDLRLVAEHAHRVAHIENGVIGFDGNPREYFQDRPGPPVVEITRNAGTELALSIDEIISV